MILRTRWRTVAIIASAAAVTLAATNAFAQMDFIKKKGCEVLIEQQEKFVNQYASGQAKPTQDAVDKAQKASADFRSQKCTQFADLASKQSGLDEKIAKLKGGK